MNGGNVRVWIAGLVMAGFFSLMMLEANGCAKDEIGTRGIQSPMRQGMPGQSGASSAQANAQLPTFPQKFEVQGPEADTFGIAVAQPGPVVVDVQAQGAPLIVTLQSPGGQPITQPATGTLRMNYTVTPQDVQRSLFWQVQIRLAQPMPPQLGGKAAGTVNVQYPPVNQALLQQAVQAQAAQQKQPTPQEQQQATEQASAQMEQAFQQRKAQFEQQQQQRRAALHAQIQPQFDQLRSRMGGQVRPRGLEGTEGSSGEPGVSAEGEIGTRALRGERLAVPLDQPLVLKQAPAVMPSAPTASSSQAIQSAGSGPGPQSVMPNPAIASLSVTQGQPGDPVMINGSGFGTGGGEVHFVLGPNKDVLYQGQIWWYDNQILVNVPDVTGLRAYNGFVYLIRSSDKAKTQLISFHFEPAQEYRSIIFTQDKRIGWPGQDYKIVGGTTNLGHQQITHDDGNPFWGYKGNDEFFMNTRLSNDWILDDVYLTPTFFKRGGAYFQEKKVGTNWPYFNVRFWVDGCFGDTASYSNYIYLVSIKGPKGVPDGVAIP